jgi:hypothetical protein
MYKPATPKKLAIKAIAALNRFLSMTTTKAEPMVRALIKIKTTCWTVIPDFL